MTLTLSTQETANEEETARREIPHVHGPSRFQLNDHSFAGNETLLTEARDCFKRGVVDDMASILPQSILAKREAVATVVMTRLADFKKCRLEGEPSLVSLLSCCI